MQGLPGVECKVCQGMECNVCQGMECKVGMWVECKVCQRGSVKRFERSYILNAALCKN